MTRDIYRTPDLKGKKWRGRSEQLGWCLIFLQWLVLGQRLSATVQNDRQTVQRQIDKMGGGGREETHRRFLAGCRVVYSDEGGRARGSTRREEIPSEPRPSGFPAS